MKKANQIAAALMLLGFFACQKSSDVSAPIALTPSATQIAVGQQLSVTLSANANAVNWTVTPSSSATKTYSLTTSKVNYFTFSQAGVYTISVNAKNIAYDSTSQSLDSCWNHGGGRSGCTNGVDTASVAVTVTGK